MHPYARVTLLTLLSLVGTMSLAGQHVRVYTAADYPYYVQLYSIRFTGTDMTLLTPGNATHEVAFRRISGTSLTSVQLLLRRP